MSKIDKPTETEHCEIPDKMRAAVYDSDVRRFALIDGIPVPSIENSEVLLKVELCGVCGTDRKKIQHNLRSGPRVFGHEIVGTIVKKGESVKSHAIGDRVVVFHHVPCEECADCSNGNYAQCKTYQTVDTTAGYGEPAGGGFAPFVRVPKLVVQKGLIPIPNNISFEQAVSIEPLDCMHKAVLKANLKQGDRVAIEGFGPIGQAIASLAQHYGAEAVDAVDINLHRSDIANVLESDFTLVSPQNYYSAEGTQCIPLIPGSNGITLIRGGTNFFSPKENSDVAFVATEQWGAILNATDHVKPGGKVVFVFDLMADAPELGFIAHQEISLKTVLDDKMSQTTEEEIIVDIRNIKKLDEVWSKLKEAIVVAKPGGSITLLNSKDADLLTNSIPDDSDLTEEMATFLINVINRQLTVIGSYSSSGIHHHKTAELIFSGKVKPSEVMKIITLDQIGEAICSSGEKYVIRH